MSVVSLYNKLNDSKFQDIEIATSATLSVLDNSIEFEINGTPSNIMISYNGAGQFTKQIPANIKVKVGKTAILITNVFKQEIPSVLFEYIGNINIYSCQVMNFDGTKIQAVINNNQNEDIINKQKTNVEDMDIILYDTPKSEIVRPFKTGLVKPSIKKSAINKFGKIQKYGKIEAETIARTIINTAPRINYEGKEE